MDQLTPLKTERESVTEIVSRQSICFNVFLLLFSFSCQPNDVFTNSPLRANRGHPNWKKFQKAGAIRLEAYM